ncbi:uncharacterized protein LOC110116672 isoform X1 [Dendrobium catenatum]|uniref:Uncharacterized protein n=1 Tax=Dendrobium catenatum TaxID=906689 RepID=A0A2I0WI95_9ASPA|nr:uncharacterized protein LOC110116672 isoform X1 [Dendrobium catenatum]PKU75362.1 hypothetical protein MA16_Dca016144 [Dendrobium catenatum]
MEDVPLIEISSVDDLLIPVSLQELGINIGSTVEAEKIEKARKCLEEVPHLSDSPEKNQKVSDRYNLRKSLAWDSAFFTGEGILNAEELATMNNTHSKAGITLPGIQELRRSSESTSTLEGDSWALEHLEVNLFENVRDSIQRSLGSSNLTTNMVHYDKIEVQKKSDAPNATTLKKIDDSSEIKFKPSTALRRHDTTRQCQEHTSKGGLVCMNLPSHGNVESKPLLRPPKVSSKTIPMPASVPGKKASIEVKKIKGATAKQQSIVACNKENGVPGIAPRTTLLTKPNSGSRTGLLLTATLGASSGSLATRSSDSRSVSSLATVQKTSANRVNGHSSSRTSKTALSISINGRTLENHHQNLAKSSLFLSKISPASSIDSFVSDSSSSISTSTKYDKSLEGSDAGSSSSVAFSSSLGAFQNSGSLSQSFTGHRTKSFINADCGSRHAGPSGLRMPRPTIGYFDKEKTLVRASNKAPKASLQNNLMKNASFSHTGATNKVKPVDLPTVRDSGLTSLSKQISKSVKENSFTKIENHKKPCPKVNKICSETVEPNHKINFRNEEMPTDSCILINKAEPNLLHPDVFARENETEMSGEQKLHYQSCRTLDQLEKVKNGLKDSDREIEKENVCHDLKTEDPSKMQRMEAVIGGDALSFTF